MSPVIWQMSLSDALHWRLGIVDRPGWGEEDWDRYALLYPMASSALELSGTDSTSPTP